MDRKNAWLGLRLSQADHDQIKARASQANLSVSEYIRSKALSDYSGPAIIADADSLKALLVELKRCGNNLNQIDHVLNRGSAYKGLEKDAVNSLVQLSKAASDISDFLLDVRNSI